MRKIGLVLLTVWLVVVLGGASGQAPVVRAQVGSLYAKMEQTYLISALPGIAQDISTAPGAGRTITLNDIAISSDTTTLAAVVMETTGNTITLGYVPAYGTWYGMDKTADVAAKKLQVTSSTTATLAVTIEYSVYQ